ncbi:ketosamine-3-kinase isoform X2 [Anabrus simplex]|uniref:ketosamine-3-kinase isoform X2 n=1 Tax=Anabrus simplex TaxID=316456 RepID=UPI0035A2A604
MEEILKEALGTVTLKPTGCHGGGCINEGEAYFIDSGTVFVKQNRKAKAREMFDGEYESLKAIAATNSVRAPDPIVVLDNPNGGAVIVLEYLDMKGLRKYSAQLGEQLAKMHLHNHTLSNNKQKGHVGKEETLFPIENFGFHVTTCCGYLPQDNTWRSDWPSFFAQQKLDAQLRMIEKDYGDREAKELWSELQLKIPTFFDGIEIYPSLLHGDLWGGNVAETINEPASFYGHHEYELAIAGMFGGFNSSFYGSYHKLIPKAPGFDARHKLYQLFHYLNHWNHFGTGYRGQSISLMKSLVK